MFAPLPPRHAPLPPTSLTHDWQLVDAKGPGEGGQALGEELGALATQRAKVEQVRILASQQLAKLKTESEILDKMQVRHLAPPP